MDIDSLTFGPDGLIPGIVQDRAGAVRMLAWLNRDALQRTVETGFVTFWSRSRQALWVKGESSGNRLRLVQLRPDCDADLGWRVYLKGGTEPTDRSAMDWLWQLNELGAGEILLTSMDRDGTGDGFDLPLLDLASQLPIPLIASGGAGLEIHFLEALQHGADAALAATLFHESILPIPRLKAYLAEHDLSIRI